MDMGLNWGTNNRLLREELQRITDSYINDRVGEQIEQVANLSLKYPHSISVVQKAIPDKQETFRFNCYQHSFGLINVESVIRIMKDHGSVYPGREFVQFLIDTRLQEVSIEQAQDGDHVVYAAGSQIQHAGKVTEEAIESKWGLMHIWRHGVYEVPLRYGSTVRFFGHISQDMAVQGFLDYARKRGVITS